MIEIYYRPHCPYCTRALALLKSKGSVFKAIDVSNPEARNDIVSRTGHKTVPIILANGKLIGGCDDLFDLDKSGKLDELL